jgi:hypothetical protein
MAHGTLTEGDIAVPDELNELYPSHRCIVHVSNAVKAVVLQLQPSQICLEVLYLLDPHLAPSSHALECSHTFCFKMQSVPAVIGTGRYEINVENVSNVFYSFQKYYS